MSRYPVLIETPSGEQKLIEASGLEILDFDHVLWDSREDGPLPEICTRDTMGILKRNGRALEIDEDKLEQRNLKDHAARRTINQVNDAIERLERMDPSRPEFGLANIKEFLTELKTVLDLNRKGV